jgi:hypothetical protein
MKETTGASIVSTSQERKSNKLTNKRRQKDPELSDDSTITSTNLVPSFVAYREARLKAGCALPCNKTICISYKKRTEYFFRTNLLDRQAVACTMSKKLETN